MGKRWISSMLLLVACAWSAGCDLTHAPAGTDSTTHFLEACSSDDGCDGLSCLCGTCSVSCTDDAACSGLAAHAVCRSASQLACGTQASVCVAECSRDSDCASASRSAHCRAGVCQIEPSPMVPDGGAIAPDSGNQPSGATANLGAVATVNAQSDAGSAYCLSEPLPACNDPAGCDWAAQQTQYRACHGPGAPYLANCGPYNAVLWVGQTMSNYYDATTGQLVGSEFIGTALNRLCDAYDPAFAAWYATLPPRSGPSLDNPNCAPPEGNCGTCESLTYAMLPYPTTWDAALAMAPCTAVRCGNFDSVTLPATSASPDLLVSVYYDASTGALAGSINRSGPPACQSYTPVSEPYFAPPTEACVSYMSSLCPTGSP